jgi:ABC-type multidrug transport system fused ATPase/permease subunit
MNQEKPKIKIDLKETYSDAKKEIKQIYNNLRRYGYWSMIVVLLIISIVFATLTIGDVYKLNDITTDEIIEQYVKSGHILRTEDRVIISDIVIEASSKDTIIAYNEYDKFLERIQMYNYIDNEGRQVRFDSIIYYLYSKTPQKILDIRNIEEWRMALLVTNSTLAVLMAFTFMKTGIQDALNAQPLREKRKELIEISRKAAKKRIYADEYFSRLHLNKLKSKRETELLDKGMQYDKYFDEYGILNEDIKVSEDESKVLKAVLKINVNRISYDKLVNYGNSKKDEEIFRDIKEYQLSTGARNIVIKTLMVIMFTFVGVSLIVTAQNGRQIMLNLVSTVIALVAGFLEYLNSYTFVTDEYSETLEFQIRELQAFVEWEVPNDIKDKINKAQLITNEEDTQEKEGE